MYSLGTGSFTVLPFRLKSQRNDEEERDEATNRAFVIEAVMIPD